VNSAIGREAEGREGEGKGCGEASLRLVVGFWGVSAVRTRCKKENVGHACGP
jgi:hypothetical protein